MLKLTIKSRVYLNLGVLAVALLLVCSVGLHAFNSASTSMQSLYKDNLLSIARIDEIYQRSLQSQQYRLEAYIHRDPAFTQHNYDGVKNNRARIGELMEQLETTPLTPEERALLDEVKAQRASIVAEGKQEIDLLLAGEYEGPKKVRIDRIEPVIDRMDATTEKLADLRRTAAQQLIESSTQKLAFERNLIIGSFVLALAISGWFAFLLSRHITRRLGEAQEIAHRVSQGHLGLQVPTDGHDEIADVMRSLHRMDTKLSEIVREVTTAATEVDRASRQASIGNDELNERTQEQAAALEETAASMEEMASTVKQTSDNANTANQVVSATRSQADQGGAVVQQAIAAMEEITSSSQRIEQIIGVIDEIAFQTNLLALNAAVEAARAGEQGRGFAVVASEVRNLAQRSATAAKEIKTLIGDSVDKVAAGSQLVNKSGQTLSGIVLGVKKVTDIVAEMAAATTEQSRGIEQINHAVANMDSATQQNAALVEESASSAKVMQQQAEHLQQLVGFFQLQGTARHATSVARQPQREASAQPISRAA